MAIIVRSTVYGPSGPGEKFLIVASALEARGDCVSQRSAWAETQREAARTCCDLARLLRESAGSPREVATIQCTHCPTPERQRNGRCLVP